MIWEHAPAWSKPRMTQAQIRKYQKDMDENRKKARKKLEEYEQSGEYEKELQELEELEQELENL